MSDVLSDAQMYLSEPDETVLTAALRNQDDIPILMDIVGDESVSVSQEDYLAKSLAGDTVRPSSDIDNTEPEDAHVREADASIQYSQEALSAAIESVLRRKLPEIVNEVVLELSKNEKA